jgi:hypothetical protein
VEKGAADLRKQKGLSDSRNGCLAFRAPAYDPLGPDTANDELGMSSLECVELLMSLEGLSPAD